MKTLDKVANQTVTAEDVESFRKDNEKYAGDLFTGKGATSDYVREDSTLYIPEEVAYDPRLINAGVVYGD